MILRLAARQHGVVTRRQALGAGLTKSMLETRVRRGRLTKVHPGVYCVGGAPRTFEQRAFAAVAWGGRGAVASHSSAAHLWRMVEAPPRLTEICSPRKRTRPPPGICAHFTTDLVVRDRGKLRNVPVTSPARTLIDLANVLPEMEVEAALQKAILGGCVTASVLRSRVRTARRGMRGPAVIRNLLPESQRKSHVDTPLEHAVAQALTCTGMPAFRREHPVYAEGKVFYLDFAYPHFHVAVEADGRRWHSDPEAFERDRLKLNALTAAGWRIVRVTSQQVRDDPAGLRARVLALLRV